MKLDVLTFVAFQAPISLVPLFIFMVQSWQPEVWAALKALGLGAPNFGNKDRQKRDVERQLVLQVIQLHGVKG